METNTILLIIAIILLTAALGVGIVNIFLSKKRKTGVTASGDVFDEIDSLNNNLNEVKNLINEHTTKEKDNLLSGITVAGKMSNLVAIKQPY